LFSKVFHNRKVRIGMMLIGLLVCFSASEYAFAIFLVPHQHEKISKKPRVIGNFTLVLEVNNVTDLYTWQVAITYNSRQLKVLNVIPGGFVGDKFPFFLTSTDTFENLLLLGGTLYGKVPGKHGSGSLATINFGYFMNDFDQPRIVSKELVFETFLLDSQGGFIPIYDSTLTLTVVD